MKKTIFLSITEHTTGESGMIHNEIIPSKQVVCMIRTLKTWNLILSGIKITLCDNNLIHFLTHKNPQIKKSQKMDPHIEADSK